MGSKMKQFFTGRLQPCRRPFRALFRSLRACAGGCKNRTDHPLIDKLESHLSCLTLHSTELTMDCSLLPDIVPAVLASMNNGRDEDEQDGWSSMNLVGPEDSEHVSHDLPLAIKEKPQQQQQQPDNISPTMERCHIMQSVYSYTSSDEYLLAMKEDLAEWLKSMYELDIDADTFMEKLENGSVLCKHANNITREIQKDTSKRIGDLPRHSKSSILIAGYSVSQQSGVSQCQLMFREDAKPHSFSARDNVSNFITWARNTARVRECLMFETDDLIMRKNERNFVLCLLEVARYGSTYGMAIPTLVRFDKEIAEQIKYEQENDFKSFTRLRQEERMAEQSSPVLSSFVSTPLPVCSSWLSRAVRKTMEFYTLSDGSELQSLVMNNSRNDISEADDDGDLVLCEKIEELVARCRCQQVIRMVRLSKGKYKIIIDDSAQIAYVRMLRNHIMVKVGDVWDTLDSMLQQKDPCRTEDSSSEDSNDAAAYVIEKDSLCEDIGLNSANHDQLVDVSWTASVPNAENIDRSDDPVADPQDWNLASIWTITNHQDVSNMSTDTLQLETTAEHLGPDGIPSETTLPADGAHRGDDASASLDLLEYYDNPIGDSEQHISEELENLNLVDDNNKEQLNSTGCNSLDDAETGRGHDYHNNSSHSIDSLDAIPLITYHCDRPQTETMADKIKDEDDDDDEITITERAVITSDYLYLDGIPTRFGRDFSSSKQPETPSSGSSQRRSRSRIPRLMARDVSGKRIPSHLVLKDRSQGSSQNLFNFDRSYDDLGSSNDNADPVPTSRFKSNLPCRPRNSPKSRWESSEDENATPQDKRVRRARIISGRPYRENNAYQWRKKALVFRSYIDQANSPNERITGSLHTQHNFHYSELRGSELIYGTNANPGNNNHNTDRTPSSMSSRHQTESTIPHSDSEANIADLQKLGKHVVSP